MGTSASQLESAAFCSNACIDSAQRLAHIPHDTCYLAAGRRVPRWEGFCSVNACRGEGARSSARRAQLHLASAHRRILLPALWNVQNTGDCRWRCSHCPAAGLRDAFKLELVVSPEPGAPAIKEPIKNGYLPPGHAG